jgi:hypothetical protein
LIVVYRAAAIAWRWRGMGNDAFTGAGFFLPGVNAMTTACGATVSGVNVVLAFIGTICARAIGFLAANATS